MVDNETLPLVLPSEKQVLLTDTLKQVSRSFYLTMRILPVQIREAISLTYLLARAADTVADTPLLSAEDKPGCLEDFRQQMKQGYEPHRQHKLIARLQHKEQNPSEESLLKSLPKLFALLYQQSAQDQQDIIKVVDILTTGMTSDLAIFSHHQGQQPTALESETDLDTYCYQVAGCVGEFWTAIMTRHIPALAGWDRSHYKKLGTDLGKALQLTNILRDIPADLLNSRCYLPAQDLQQQNLTPQDLLSSENESRGKQVLDKWIRQSVAFYASGETYLLAIPRHCIRLRLAVLWPMLIGLHTQLLLAENKHWLNPAIRIKVSRSWIYKMMSLSLVVVVSNTLLRRWISSYTAAVSQALTSTTFSEPSPDRGQGKSD